MTPVLHIRLRPNTPRATRCGRKWVAPARYPILVCPDCLAKL